MPQGSQPLTEPPAPGGPALGPEGLVGKLFRLVFTDPWHRIDTTARAPRVGRLTARQATLFTGITAALMLTVLRFVVMDRDVQNGMAALAVESGHWLSPDLGLYLGRYQRLLVHLAWVVGCFACYFAVPALCVRFVFGLPLSEFYLSARGYMAQLPKYALLFLPVGVLVLVVAHSPEFLRQYPFYDPHIGWGDLLVWEFAYAIQFFSLEFFFRGFLLRGMVAELGSMAMMVMVIPYCMIHFGKPLPECLGSIIAGAVLGTLAMDTRSIWGGVTIHVAVAWAMDAAATWLKLPTG